jgi:hypothetical protein
MVQQIRQANGQIKISVQVRSDGDVRALIDLLGSLNTSVDGVSILTSPETIETAKALVSELRLLMPEAHAPSIPQEPSKRPLAWSAIIPPLVFGTAMSAAVVVLLGLILTIVWLRSTET